MSAIPQEALRPKQTSSYLKAINENTDDALLTDDELYQLKGGNNNVIAKVLVGSACVAAYLYFSKRIPEVTNFNISGSTFLKANLFFLLGSNTYGFLSSRSYRARLLAHRSALLRRFMLNSAYMKQFKKAPKVQ